MMDFARVRQAAKSSVNINKIIETSLRLAGFDKLFQKLKLKKDFETNLPNVFADADQLQQVFLNLFLNARDAMPNGGELLIKTYGEEKFVVIEISDSGVGINDEDFKKIFDPFYTTKSTGSGTGLGLAVCYGIITAHDGKIEVSNNIENNIGTKFTVYLPTTEKAAEN
jgi:two-component system NtrC family sensor kinase